MKERNIIKTKVPLSKLEVSYDEGWPKFINDFRFFIISGFKFEHKSEEESPEDHFGEPLDTDEENFPDEESEPDEEEKINIDYGHWQNELTRALIRIRKKGINVLRVHISGGKSLVMLNNSIEDPFEALSKELGNGYEIKTISTDEMTIQRSNDTINLLTQYMEYVTAEKTSTPIPDDMLLCGYYRHQTGKMILHILSKGMDVSSTRLSASDYKNSFLSLYIKNSLLYVKTESYYEDGTWVPNIGSEKIKRRVCRNMVFNMAPVDTTRWTLTESPDNASMSTRFIYRMKGKTFFSARPTGTSKEASFRLERARATFMQKFLVEFNSFYKGIVQLNKKSPEFLTFKEESRNDETLRERERYVGEINRIRKFYDLELDKKLRIIRMEREGEKNPVIDEKEKALLECFKETFGKARYHSHVKMKYGDMLRLTIPSDYKSELIAIYTVCYKDPDDINKIRYTEVMETVNENNGFWELETPTENNGRPVKSSDNSMDIKLRLNIWGIPDSLECGIGNPDLPPQIVLKRTINSTTKDINFAYRDGLGIDECEVELGDKCEEDTLNIMVIKDHDKKLDAYKYTRFLNVQHMTLDTLSTELDDMRSSCLTILNELYIRAQVMYDLIPDAGNVSKALYIKHCPKKGNRPSYKRYFLYDRDAEMKYKELRAESAGDIFPQAVTKDTYGDSYAIEIGNGRYIIEKTDIVPLTGDMFDDGHLLPIEQIGSKSAVHQDNFSGTVGIHIREDIYDNCLYYIVGDFKTQEDIGVSGVTKFPHVYKVTSEYGPYPKAEDILPMLENTLVRLKRYSVLPIIFKYIREWAYAKGQVYKENKDILVKKDPIKKTKKEIYIEEDINGQFKMVF